jgi:hypothetical protein
MFQKSLSFDKKLSHFSPVHILNPEDLFSIIFPLDMCLLKLHLPLNRACFTQVCYKSIHVVLLELFAPITRGEECKLLKLLRILLLPLKSKYCPQLWSHAHSVLRMHPVSSCLLVELRDSVTASTSFLRGRRRLPPGAKSSCEFTE